jgi:gamma-glutamyltranspeptidase/glutathione hydrolase
MSPFDFSFPYPSRRMPVLAENVIATSQPLAAQAGLQILREGGNAIDAAIATAITLTVVEPTMNGIGGDLFAIVWDGRSLHGLNASGRSPASWTRELFAEQKVVPRRGWLSVTVPGAVSGWVALSKTFGRLRFEKLFESAIGYARDGFIVAPVTANTWQTSFDTLKDFPNWRTAFAPNDRAPLAGEWFACADQARTLEEIAQSHGESFYRGRLAQQIASASPLQRAGLPLITTEDLASHQAEWVNPISTEFKNHLIHELPPNAQGIASLIALGILRHLNLSDFPVDSPDSIHLQIEAMKLAFADLRAHISDPAHMKCLADDLLDENYLAQRATLVDRARATIPAAGVPTDGGTVYLTAADREGRMVSLIQSNYSGFGSGIVVPGTGIALQNRGYGFVLTPGHPNEVGPRKRPFHTIIPGFVTQAGQPVMSFGVMGGAFQAQGHVQMIVRIFEYGQNPQAAIDAPRWQVLDGRRVLVESGISEAVLDNLKSRGHEIEIGLPTEFGGAQVIYRLDRGYLAASEGRKDGQAVGF